MPDSTPTSNLPQRQVPLDRTTIERVLARAAELQVQEGEGGGELLSESQLVDIGREVGLSTTAVTQALAEERSRVVVPDDTGFLVGITGPGFASATRVVRGIAADVLARLDGWMQNDECLQVQRRFPDRMTWEPRAGWLGMLQRGLNFSGRGYYLCRATQVAATVVPASAGSVVVRLDADIRESRRSRLRAGAVVLATGLVAGGATALAATLAPVALPLVIAAGSLPAALAAGIGYEVAKRHRELVEKAQLALEQMLDRLEFGPAAIKAT